MIFSGCSITAVITIVSYSLMDRIDVPLKIGLLRCFVITFGAWISVNTMHITYVLEQSSFSVGSKHTLVTFELLVSMNVFDVRFQVGGECGFKLA